MREEEAHNRQLYEGGRLSSFTSTTQPSQTFGFGAVLIEEPVLWNAEQ